MIYSRDVFKIDVHTYLEYINKMLIYYKVITHILLQLVVCMITPDNGLYDCEFITMVIIKIIPLQCRESSVGVALHAIAILKI